MRFFAFGLSPVDFLASQEALDEATRTGYTYWVDWDYSKP